MDIGQSCRGIVESNIACGVMDVSLSFRGRSVSNITSGIMDIGQSCRGIVESNIASGVVDVGKSLRGLHALLRDGAGKSQGNGRQENKELHVGESRTGTGESST